jgi:hypothetical protein
MNVMFGKRATTGDGPAFDAAVLSCDPTSAQAAAKP